MKEEIYLLTKIAIKHYLQKRGCFCFRQNIIRDLIEAGNKKTNVILALREMRKRKEIRKAFRRWGLGI